MPEKPTPISTPPNPDVKRWAREPPKISALRVHGAWRPDGRRCSQFQARAIEVSIYLVRTFIALREALASTHEFDKRLDELEKSLERGLIRHDRAISDIFAAIRALMNPPGPKPQPIGFVDPE